MCIKSEYLLSLTIHIWNYKTDKSYTSLPKVEYFFGWLGFFKPYNYTLPDISNTFTAFTFTSRSIAWEH